MLRNADKGLAFITGYKEAKHRKVLMFSHRNTCSYFLFSLNVFVHSECSNRNIEMWTCIETRKDCLLCEI